MWLKLTKPNGVAFLLNTEYVTQVTEVVSGGVQVSSSVEVLDADGKRKPKTYRATENISDVLKALDKPAGRSRGG